jgi:hypothetical protein
MKDITVSSWRSANEDGTWKRRASTGGEFNRLGHTVLVGDGLVSLQMCWQVHMIVSGGLVERAGQRERNWTARTR